MAEQLFSGVHCSLDGRSWTNPITNTTFLAEVELEKYLRSLFMSGKTPPDVQLPFLHEATHHWCFLSPVGSTLACLQLRAQRRAFGLLHNRMATRDEKSAMLNDLIRYTTATHLMRSFAEGLALFAQFDAVPSTSSVESDVMAWATNFFAVDDFFGTYTEYQALDLIENIMEIDESKVGGYNYLLVSRLIEARLSKKALESKAGLLSNPLTCANGGYLPGYLLVKNLWRLTMAKCLHFADSDLFLTYLRSFFYGDYGFIAVLLNPVRQNEWATANAILAYFCQRFRQFWDSDLKSDVVRFEKEVLEYHELFESCGDLLNHGLFRLCTDSQAHQLGQKRLQILIDEVASYNSATFDDFLHAMDRATLFQRDIMCVGSIKLALSISRERDMPWRELFDEDCKEVTLSPRSGKVLLKLPVPAYAEQIDLPLEMMMPQSGHYPANGKVLVCFPSEVEEGEGEGSLDLYFSPLAGYKVCAISFKEKPIAYLFLDWASDEASRKLFMEKHAERVYLEKTHVPGLGQILEYVVDNGDYWVKATLDHILKQIPVLIDQFYLPRALLHVPDEKLQQCLHAMHRRGFYEIVGKDGGLVRALALLGISASFTTSRKAIAKWFSSYELDLDTTIAALRQYGEQYNLPEIFEQGDRLICFV